MLIYKLHIMLIDRLSFQQMLNFQNTVQRQQALALMCRIYVGSINFEIKEDTIRQVSPVETCVFMGTEVRLMLT